MQTWEIRDGNGRFVKNMNGTEQQAKNAAAAALLVGSYDEVSPLQVDESSMGTEWRGESGDLVMFCEMLAEQTGREVDAITDTYNGAKNADNVEPVDEDTWNEVLELHYEMYPEAWAC